MNKILKLISYWHYIGHGRQTSEAGGGTLLPTPTPPLVPAASRTCSGTFSPNSFIRDRYYTGWRKGEGRGRGVEGRGRGVEGRGGEGEGSGGEGRGGGGRS